MKNDNLLRWYKHVFDHQFSAANINPVNHHILEIGSGTSPLKIFYPQVKTSDIMKLNYLDYQFDAIEIDTCAALDGKSFDLIIMTNVLHHLQDPILFLQKAASKLKKNGRVVFTEPYYSGLSWTIYKSLHHEPSDFSIDYPRLSEVKGPLSSSNMAMPYMIFFKRKDWLEKLSSEYDLNSVYYSYFTGLSYFITGGISKRIPYPRFLYSLTFNIDQKIAQFAPKLWASFATICLTKKS